MSSGTTEEELLRKLDKQLDILALMEVKMKEMKGSILTSVSPRPSSVKNSSRGIGCWLWLSSAKSTGC